LRIIDEELDENRLQNGQFDRRIWPRNSR